MIKRITYNICIIFLFLVIFTSSSFAVIEYTKEMEMRPIRLTYIELQKEIDKISNLIISANAAYATKTYRERENVTFLSGARKVDISGHQFFPTKIEIPSASYGFDYLFLITDERPITRVSITFNDYYRKISVSGNSPEQVDAIFSTPESGLGGYSTPIGGRFVRQMGLFFLGFLFTVIVIIGSIYCIQNKNMKMLGGPIFSLFGIILIATLPFEDILAGFAVYQGEASLLVRYGDQISFFGFLITLLGIPISYYLPSRFTSSQKSTE